MSFKTLNSFLVFLKKIEWNEWNTNWKELLILKNALSFSWPWLVKSESNITAQLLWLELVRITELCISQFQGRSTPPPPPRGNPRHLTATEAQIVGNLIEQKPGWSGIWPSTKPTSLANPLILTGKMSTIQQENWLTMTFQPRPVGHFIVQLTHIVGNLIKYFEKRQMPRGLPGDDLTWNWLIHYKTTKPDHCDILKMVTKKSAFEAIFQLGIKF